MNYGELEINFKQTLDDMYQKSRSSTDYEIQKVLNENEIEK